MYFDDYIFKKILSKDHNVQAGIYFIFAMQLKVETDPVYQA